MLLSKRTAFSLGFVLWAGFLTVVMEPLSAMSGTFSSSPAYKPTPRPQPQRTEGGGSRGCLNTESVALQLLVPKDHTAFTSSAYPTLSWYISAVPSIPLELSLVEEGVAEPILVKQLPVKNAGLMKFKLDEDTAGLEVGKQYRWTVSLICNPSRPSQSIYARAWLERVPVSKDVAKKIANRSAYDKALAYIQAGIWYDAIAVIYESQLTDSDAVLASNLFQKLLQQVGIAEAGAIKLL